jgi:hypothetical protein
MSGEQPTFGAGMTVVVSAVVSAAETDSEESES